MEEYEYASYWIWNRDDCGDRVFRGLKALTASGWQVIGRFIEMPEVDPKAGLWVLRRKKAVLSRAA